MPIVRVEILEGRSQETKQKVAEEITNILTRHLGASASHIYVMFEEHKGSDWSVGGVFLNEGIDAVYKKKPS